MNSLREFFEPTSRIAVIVELTGREAGRTARDGPILQRRRPAPDGRCKTPAARLRAAGWQGLLKFKLTSESPLWHPNLDEAELLPSWLRQNSRSGSARQPGSFARPGNNASIPLRDASQIPASVIRPDTSLAGVTSNAKFATGDPIATMLTV